MMTRGCKPPHPCPWPRRKQPLPPMPEKDAWDFLRPSALARGGGHGSCGRGQGTKSFPFLLCFLQAACNAIVLAAGKRRTRIAGAPTHTPKNVPCDPPTQSMERGQVSTCHAKNELLAWARSLLCSGRSRSTCSFVPQQHFSTRITQGPCLASSWSFPACLGFLCVSLLPFFFLSLVNDTPCCFVCCANPAPNILHLFPSHCPFLLTPHALTPLLSPTEHLIRRRRRPLKGLGHLGFLLPFQRRAFHVNHVLRLPRLPVQQDNDPRGL